MERNGEKHQCHFCKRKYQRYEKLEAHTEKMHPFACHGQNQQKLTLAQRQYLLTQLQRYVSTIESAHMFGVNALDNAILEYINWNGIDPISVAVCFVWVSHMFLPQDYTAYLKKGFTRPANLQAVQIVDGVLFVSKGDEDSSLIRDLQRITRTHMTFCQRIQESGILQKVVSSSNQLDMVFDEFERFLNLGYQWNGDNFCPTMIIDLVWHASMLDNEQYNKLIIGFMGKPLAHCLEENEGEEKQQARFATFQKHFINYHGKEPLNIDDCTKEEEKDVFENLEQRYLALQKEIEDRIKEKEENAKRKKLEDEERWKQSQIEYDLRWQRNAAIIAEQKRLGTYVEPERSWIDSQC